jgi:ribonucleoside-diphosphate reductase alpha chain
MGHLKMLEAIQPFISGAISKTINMPNKSTVEDIMDAYIESWKRGIKCVAIYRDGSKGSQPVTTVKEKRSRATRVRLPDDVDSKRHKFTINGQDVILQCGLYPDGTLGEIFITSAQQGSTMRGLLDTWAITFSMSLQYGVPLKVLVKKFLNTQFEPHGFTGKKDIVFCSSIVDYVVRYLALNFLTEKEIKSIGISINENIEKDNQTNDQNIKQDNDHEDSPISEGRMCETCGSIMKANGSCKVCPVCGSTTGCS